jgi:elongation factor P
LITATAIRNGMVLKLNNELYVVTDFMHVTPGKGHAFMQASLRNLRTGKVTRQRFRSSDTVEAVTLEPRKVQFLYTDADNSHFMDLENYNTISLPGQVVGKNSRYLTEGLELDAQFCKGQVVGLELPKQVSLKVVETVPGVKGDSVSSNTKPATLETGFVLQVPLFVKVGDEIQVDTRTGEYLGRT